MDESAYNVYADTCYLTCHCEISAVGASCSIAYFIFNVRKAVAQRCNGRTWSISRIQVRIETILPCSGRFVAYRSSPSIPSIPRVPGMEGYTVDESLADIERQTTICSDTRAYKQL